ncbi:MAG TPA: PAS-domain containing protein [Stellaceae bacterium]|nr:PAS-domain containing protein [Stellaceae bacterium]
MRRRLGLKHAVVAFSAVLILAFAGILAQSSLRAHRQIVGDAEARAGNLLRSAQQNTMRTLLSVDAMLGDIEQALATTYRDAPIDGAEIRQLLHRMDARLTPVQDLLILDDAGRPVAGSGLSSGRLADLSRSDFLDSMKDSGSALHLSRPRRWRPGDSPFLFMSRRLSLPGGFHGVLAAAVPVQSFADAFAAAAPDNGYRIALRFLDGTPVASEPPADAAPSAVAPVSGDGEIVRSRAIAGQPLIVSVTVDMAQLLRRWHRERRDYLVLSALIAFTIGSLTWLLVGLLERRQQHLQELRRNEAKLVQQSALLQSTLEHMGEGLSVFDRNHRLLAWNDRFVAMLDLPSGVGHGTRFEDILRLQAVRGDFGPVDIESEVRERIERVRTELAETSERTTLSGRVIETRRRRMPSGGFVTVYSDVTERRRVEQEMIDARNQAEIANRSKGEFLANMSHELRTPLNAIIGFSDILQNEKFGPVGNKKYLEYAHDIHNSGVHLLDLISDVLDMSKIEAGKLELYEEEVVIADLVTACLSMVRERARERGIRIAADLGPQSIRLWADQRAMKQILLNILSNAVKFSRDGSAVTITAGHGTDGGAIISVADAGIGMTEEQIERARQPFGQAGPATTRSYGGTGLGLPITQRLVELHGGVLRIESRPGEGTTVSVMLPPSRSLGSMKQTA